MSSYKEELHLVFVCLNDGDEMSEYDFINAVVQYRALREQYWSEVELMFALDIGPKKLARWRASDPSFPAADYDERGEEIFPCAHVVAWVMKKVAARRMKKVRPIWSQALSIG